MTLKAEMKEDVELPTNFKADANADVFRIVY
jgi:hypothetical protein